MTDLASKPSPSSDEQDDILLSCRYGELEDVQQFVVTYGAQALADVRDANGNMALHMVCGNGHEDVLEYLLSQVPFTPLLATQNSAGSTPLHWAALNAHLGVAQQLVKFPSGPGVDLIDVKNTAGHTPLGEAEMAGWEDGARWFVEVMNLGDAPKAEEGPADEGEGEPEDGPVDAQDIEVEIEDADGRVAKMSISKGEVSSPGRGS